MKDNCWEREILENGCQRSLFHLKITTLVEEVFHGKLMMREEISLEANIEANGREIFDTDQEIGSMVLLNPISSAIKLGFRSLFAFASSTQVR